MVNIRDVALIKITDKITPIFQFIVYSLILKTFTAIIWHAAYIISDVPPSAMMSLAIPPIILNWLYPYVLLIANSFFYYPEL